MRLSRQQKKKIVRKIWIIIGLLFIAAVSAGYILVIDYLYRDFHPYNHSSDFNR